MALLCAGQCHIPTPYSMRLVQYMAAGTLANAAETSGRDAEGGYY
jgi:hypothetical protein